MGGGLGACLVEQADNPEKPRAVVDVHVGRDHDPAGRVCAGAVVDRENPLAPDVAPAKEAAGLGLQEPCPERIDLLLETAVLEAQQR
jgi:hypothetical protein